MEKLKPCPFCGGKAKERESYVTNMNGTHVKHYYCSCLTCHVSTESFKTITAARKAWNQRADDVHN
ncbi:Lar family restriction alleviation protein [Pectinatus haikarae]|uniref:Lar family restriction alleviation protein n=1 Tax=Pectinatus haikarae TaxID=349096 RepID=A0ABT9Y8D8_9FIRM|nr:Lar family restriction alleviation protein [Pectinatus haikarae]MDQ0204096.1 Lar family restriction alleviation protein [Pectinatus haikarae]